MNFLPNFLKRNGIKHTVIYLFGGITQKAAAFLLVPFFTRLMPPVEFGLLSFWMAVLAALQILSGLGIDAAVNRLFHDHTKDKFQQRSFLMSMLLWRWILTIPIIVLLFTVGKLLSPYWTTFNTDPYLFIVLIAASMQAVIDTILAAYRTSRNASKFFYVVIISTIFLVVANIIYVGLFRLNAIGALLAALTSSSLTAILASAFFIRGLRPAKFDKVHLWPAIKYGLPTVPQKMGNWLNNLSNRVLITQLASLVAVAQYQLAYTGGAIITLLVTSVNSAYVPWYYQNRIAGISDKRKIATLDYAIIAALGSVCVGLMIFSHEFILIAAPPSYQEAEILIPAIAVGCFIFAQYTQFLKVLHFHKRTGVASLSVLIPGLLTIPMNFLVIPKFGALGAAWVTCIAFSLTLISVIFISRLVDDEMHNLFRLICANIVVVALALILPATNNWSEWTLISILTFKFSTWIFISVLISFILFATDYKYLLSIIKRQDFNEKL